MKPLAAILLLAGPIQERSPAPSAADLLRPSLRLAVAQVQAFEARLFELGLLRAADGRVLRDLEVLRGNAALEAFLVPRLETLELGDTRPALGLVVECLKHNEGSRAAALAFGDDARLEPEHLAALVDEVLLSAAPLRSSGLAQELHGRAMERLELAPLGNGAARYVLFGFLHHAPFWERREARRVELLSALIDAGLRSPLVGDAVLGALEPPLARREGRTGHGIAGPHAELRGPVGFAPRHADQVRDLLLGLEELRAQGPADQSLEQRHAFVLDEREVVRLELNPQGHLSSYLASLSRRIRQELGPPGAQASMRRGTLDERLEYWTHLAESVAFPAFHAELLAEVRAMLAWEDDLAETDRLGELVELRERGPLSNAETQELARLERGARRQRDRLVGHLVDLLVGHGQELHFDLVASTLRRDLPVALGDMPAVHQRGLLQTGWRSLAAAGNPRATGLIASHLEGEDALPDYALDPLLRMTGAFGHPGGPQLLQRVLDEGTLEQRSAALANSRWLPPERYGAELERLLKLCDDSEVAREERLRARDGVLTSLTFRGDAAARALLLRAFEEGRWADASEPGSWIHAGRQHARRALRALSPADFARLLAAGKIDGSLTDLRP